jgi:hypothetical protein
MALYGKVASNLAQHETIEIPKTFHYGLAWPVGERPTDPYFGKSSSMNLITGQLQQLLLTKKGERVMLPDYGVAMDSYFFEPLTEDLASQAASEVMTAIRKYAQNIKVLSLRFFQDENLISLGMPGFKISLTVMPSEGNQTLDVDIVI